MKRDNRGITLIELIVTVAIIAIFSGVVVNFITTGSSSYQSTSKTTRVQMDAQELLNEIQNLIIDTNRGVYYTSGTLENMGEEIGNDIDSGSAAGSRVLLFCNEEPETSQPTLNSQSIYTLDVLEWSENKVYYTQYKKRGKSSNSAPEPSSEPDPGNETAPAVFSEPSLLSDGDNVKFGQDDITKKKAVLTEGVTGFHADISKIEDNGTIRFQIMVNNGGKEISTLHTVNLRNAVQLVDMREVFVSRLGLGNAMVKIIKCPEKMDPETKTQLKCTYENVDETSIRWTILEGEGELPDNTGMSVWFWAGTHGTVKVKVSAKSLSNGKIVDDEKTITINPGAQQPATELTPDRPSILVAAGTESVDLGSAVSWSEGNTPIASAGLTWSSEEDHLKVTPDGKLSVGAEAFHSAYVYAENPATKARGRLEINVARIVLDDPGHTHYTGDPKPTLSWKYMVNGSLQNDISPTVTVKKAGDAQNYPWGSTTFTDADIDNWTVDVSYDLQAAKIGYGGYGTVKDSKSFAVEGRSQNAQLIIGADKDNDVLIASGIKEGNSSYSCSRYNEYGIHVVLPDNTSPKCDMTWRIIGNSDPSTMFHNDQPSIETRGDKDASLRIGKEEKGFTIKVDIIVYDNTSNYSVKTGSFTAQKEVRVLHDIEIRTNAPKNKDETAIFLLGKEYDLNLIYHIGEKEIAATAENSIFRLNWDLEHYGIWKEGKYTPRELTYGIHKGVFSIQKINGVYPDIWTEDTFDFEVQHNEITSQ